MLQATPTLRIAQHQFTQRVAIIVNQLTRDDDPTFIQRTVEMAKTFEQQTGQFCRITLPLARHRIYRPHGS